MTNVVVSRDQHGSTSSLSSSSPTRRNHHHDGYRNLLRRGLLVFICMMTFAVLQYSSHHGTLKMLLSSSRRAQEEAARQQQEDDEFGRGGIFRCGWESIGLEEAIFPDYTKNFNEHWEFSARIPTRHDILVTMGMPGICQKNPELFPGKVLMINGESKGDVRTMGNTLTKEITYVPGPTRKTFYQIGAIEETSQSIGGTYFVTMLAFAQPNYVPSWDTLTDINCKPINTGKYNAISYLNSNLISGLFREDIVAKLSHILPIHYGGKLKGERRTVHSTSTPNRSNIAPMPNRPPTSNWKQLTPYLLDYKFCFAMENTNKSFYITEKILNAFLAGCIPIYWGTPEVMKIFNPKAFIYIGPGDDSYDDDDDHTTNLQDSAAFQQIQYLANNDTAYYEMLYQQPILGAASNNNNDDDDDYDDDDDDITDTLRMYFSYSDDIGNGYLKEKIRTKMGILPPNPKQQEQEQQQQVLVEKEEERRRRQDKHHHHHQQQQQQENNNNNNNNKGVNDISVSYHKNDDDHWWETISQLLLLVR